MPMVQSSRLSYRPNLSVESDKLSYLEGEKELRLQILEQLLLVTLIIGRWILPKGDISREQLSQILLAYLVEQKTSALVAVLGDLF